MNIKELKTEIIKNLKELSPESYNEAQKISLPLFRLNRTLFEKGEEILSKDYSLTQTELDILSSLYYTGAKDFTLSPTQLYEIMLFSSGGMTKVLKKLEAKGYIVRLGNSEDKRSKLVQITSLGKEITAKALKDIIEFEASYYKKLNEEEQKEFQRLLEKILD